MLLSCFVDYEEQNSYFPPDVSVRPTIWSAHMYMEGRKTQEEQESKVTKHKQVSESPRQKYRTDRPKEKYTQKYHHSRKDSTHHIHQHHHMLLIFCLSFRTKIHSLRRLVLLSWSSDDTWRNYVLLVPWKDRNRIVIVLTGEVNGLWD